MNKFFQVSSIVDELVFAWRSGERKRWIQQDLLTTRRLVICAECDLLVEVSHRRGGKLVPISLLRPARIWYVAAGSKVTPVTQHRNFLPRFGNQEEVIYTYELFRFPPLIMRAHFYVLDNGRETEKLIFVTFECRKFSFAL